MMLIDKKPMQLIDQFLFEYNNINRIDINESKEKIKNLIKYHKGDKNQRINLKYLIELENIWYAALDKNLIDYSVYDHGDYFIDLFVCWVVYSRGYMKSILKNSTISDGFSIYNLMGNINSIADFGCGIGYTTAALKEIFKCTVYGTNIKNTKQWYFCEYLSNKYGFNLIDNNELKGIGKIDLIFASEYFEHIHDPLDHLEFIISELEPRYLIVANSFNTISIGHFEKYILKKNNKLIDQSEINKYFIKLLMSKGYIKLKTKLWNNRPNLYVKNQ